MLCNDVFQKINTFWEFPSLILVEVDVYIRPAYAQRSPLIGVVDLKSNKSQVANVRLGGRDPAFVVDSHP
ncbi:hypothetical protein CDAR_86471 [Caerostris darwini]|uniref:Uncharacterized protein n=1 Tax=Caerostris darwini TaxID=1538125 RepID=A0AAV4NRR3_9ARAC|nr:hypothetical protein CDAR_86471 [Caerostris darwini]